MSDITQFTLQLEQLISQLENPPVAEALAAAVPMIERDLKTKFDNEQDPYGNHWNKRKGNFPWHINNHTGELDSTRSVTTDGKQITVSYNTDYAQYVQDARAIVPEDEMPIDWLRIIDLELYKAWRLKGS